MKIITRYLIEDAGIKRITAHILTSNKASERIAQNAGYVKKVSNARENWGEGKEIEIIDIFVYNK